jgi:hypothetical protein
MTSHATGLAQSRAEDSTLFSSVRSISQIARNASAVALSATFAGRL